MDYLLLYLVACTITFVLVHAEILDILKIRPFLFKCNFLKKLLKCSFCTSFYVGIALAVLLLPFNQWFIFIFSVPAIVFLWDRIVILLDEKIIELENKRKEK
jgi:hypothetical protein